MTTAAELIARLRARGVQLRGEEGQLTLSGPKGVLTDEFRELLVEHKAEILAHLDREPSGRVPGDRDALRRRDRGGKVLQSFAQQRLWFLDQIQPRSAIYNMSPAFRLRGPLNQEALERSLVEIIGRHEALRTRLVSEDGTPLQVVDQRRTIALPPIELSHLPPSERIDEAGRILAEAAQRGFDLAEDFLVRASLVRLDAEDHILGLVIHHAVFDGWSTGVLLRELASLYPAFKSGRRPSMPEVPLQYADYAEWQRSWLEGGELERQSRYWISQLGGMPPTLDLPADHMRPSEFSGRGANLRWRVSPPTVDALADLARSERATLFMTLLAAFAVVLHRYTGSSQMVIGTPVANRGRAELEELIGLFANTLVLRADLSGHPTFRELLGRVRESCVGAYAHSEMPFERLVQELQPARDMSRSPLFQVMLGLQDASVEGIALDDITVERFEVDEVVSRTDLSLWMRPDDDGLAVVVEYYADVFEAQTVERMMRSFDTVLDEVVGDPDRPIPTLKISAPSDRHRSLRDWNATQSPVGAASVVERVAERVEAEPDRVVVSGSGRELSYSELWTRAGHVARFLAMHEVGPGSVVGVSILRSPEVVIALLGVWRAGAAYLPLDPEFPAERLAFMVDDSGACLVLTDDDMARTSWAVDALTLAEAERRGTESKADLEVDTSIGSDDLAYILYTSGSTGRPKGVEIEHGNLANFLTAMADEPGLSRDDVVLAVTTLSFDISGLELWLPLWVGARVEIAEQEEIHDGAWLLERLDASGADVMQATPSTWRMLLDAGWEGRLTKVLCGGETFPAGLVAPLLERADEVWNLYGPTETTVWSTAHQVEAADAERSVPIGRPIANTQVYVMDPHAQPTPQGVPGELWIGGHGVARGYHDRAELTVDRFVTSPFDDAARLYRTGDLVRWRNDGMLEHLGRLDDQVKVHGHRIELGEIETILADHDDLRQAVAAVQGRDADARLVAYVVPEPGRPVVGSELRGFLRHRLPDYMVPGIIAEIDALPRTPNGKIDRNALPDPTDRAPRRTHVEPDGPTERAFADIWRSLLDVDEVSATDNFFELGGHSLLAVRAAALLADRSGTRINPRELFFQNLRQIVASTQEPRA